jgi:hypothetical protein
MEKLTDSFLLGKEFTIDSVVNFLESKIETWLTESYEELNDMDNDESFDTLHLSIDYFIYQHRTSEAFITFFCEHSEEITKKIQDIIHDS